MNEEKVKPRVLKFECPHCGGKELVQAQRGITEYTDVDSIAVTDGRLVVELGRTNSGDHGETEYTCGDCLVNVAARDHELQELLESLPVNQQPKEGK